MLTLGYNVVIPTNEDKYINIADYIPRSLRFIISLSFTICCLFIARNFIVMLRKTVRMANRTLTLYLFKLPPGGRPRSSARRSQCYAAEGDKERLNGWNDRSRNDEHPAQQNRGACRLCVTMERFSETRNQVVDAIRRIY